VKRFLAVLLLAGGSTLLTASCAGPEPEPLGDLSRYRMEAASRPKPPQDAPLSGLNLERALVLAERSHPELAASAARVEAAEGRAAQAGAFPNPALVARMESAPFQGAAAGDAEYLAGISQRLPVGGRLGAASEAERLEAERLRREREIQGIEIRTRVRGAFATALFSAEVARLQEELLALSRRAVTVARARRDAGDATADEVARAEMEEARARLEEDKAHGLRDLAFVALAASLGDPGLRIESVEGGLEGALEIPTVESVLASLDAGPRAALARADVDAARARVDQARAERIPDVTLDLFYRRLEHSKTDTFDVGVVVPLPVFDRNGGRIREAEAERREAEARARSTRGEAVRRVREAHVKLSEAVHHTRLAKQEILPKAETVLKVAEARYAAGDLSLADLLPIRREYASARLAYLDGLREVMEAWAELRAFLR
jgi:cobalt-zinc-cadmium efflux system outer membrane protein